MKNHILGLTEGHWLNDKTSNYVCSMLINCMFFPSETVGRGGTWYLLVHVACHMWLPKESSHEHNDMVATLRSAAKDRLEMLRGLFYTQMRRTWKI